ncbi:MAG: hypothetical protein HC819_20640 [Cyclobacteriaceae bacterium]|nr:hypothetical protein [Cyclobacteriaceae bacterium]
MSKNSIWQDDFRIGTHQLDPKGQTQITAICHILQEGASLHAELAGFGFEAMLQKGQLWVLARLKVEMIRYPVWRERLTLKTWSRGQEGMFYIRDFMVEDEQQYIIAKASSAWAAINHRTRRPEPVEGLEQGLHSLADQIVLVKKLNKLPELQNQKLLRKRMVEYTDIDILYHVNNVKYIELIINSFPKETLLDHTLASIEINFLGETKYGEDVLIFAEPVTANAQW